MSLVSFVAETATELPKKRQREATGSSSEEPKFKSARQNLNHKTASLPSTSGRRTTNRHLHDRQRQENLNTRVQGNAYGLAEVSTGSTARLPVLKSDFAMVTAVFRDLDKFIIDKIKEQGVYGVVGCVAWLTSFPILDALATKHTVQIVMQAEDYLRADGSGSSRARFVQDLKGKYGKLKCKIRSICGLDLDTTTPPGIDAITTRGEWRMPPISIYVPEEPKKDRSHPKMHNKFLVFLDDNWKPVSVWTGSFNMAHCSTNSLENGLFIEDVELAQRYYEEWLCITLLSHSLEDVEVIWPGKMFDNPSDLRFGT